MERIIHSSNNPSEKVHVSLHANTEIFCFVDHFLLCTHPTCIHQQYPATPCCCELLLYFTLQAVLVWITIVKLLMALELSLWVAKARISFQQIDPQGYVAAPLKTRDSYLQVILCVLFPFRLMGQQAMVNLAGTGIISYQ